MTTYVAGQPLTAAELNASFEAVAPPASSPLIGSTGTAFTLVAVGTGLTFGSQTLSLALTAAILGAVDLSTLPTSDPGGGRLWLNGGVLMVGAV